MGRLKKTEGGFTLIELVIAIALSAVVLITAANLMINFGAFSHNVVRSEASLMGTALGVFEEITKRISIANQVDFPAVVPLRSSIVIHVDTPNTPSVPGDDTLYTYWLTPVVPATAPVTYNLMRTGDPGDGAGTILATNISTLLFANVPGTTNAINVTIQAMTRSGARDAGGTEVGGSMELLETTVVMKAKDAN